MPRALRVSMLIGLIAAAAIASSSLVRAQNPVPNWPTWRGPLGTGVSEGAAPPVHWSEDLNVKWKVAIPGQGSASPVIWGDRIFVATALAGAPAAASPPPAAPRPRRRGFGGSPPTTSQKYILLALDRSDGSVLWQRVAHEGVPHEGKHATNSFASASPLTDGTHVFAFYGSRGLYCYDLDGNLVWGKDLGDMQAHLGFGEGASPALYGDMLVVTWDHSGQSFIVGLDKNTGAEKWRQARDEPTTWASPLIVADERGAQVVTAGVNRTRGYDLESGRLLWQGPGLTPNPIPTPVYANGLAYLTSGFRGNKLLAVRLAEADGEVTDDAALAWRIDRDTPYVASPLLYGDNLYFIKSLNAIVSNVDPKTGETRYGPQRLEGLGTVYASPVGAGGHVYIFDRDGNALVLDNGAQFRIVARNSLDDGFDASPAIVGGEMYLRGQRFLYRISAD